MSSVPQTTKAFCSLVSQELGEDPIGCANMVDQFLVVEGALPWPGALATLTCLPEDLVAYLASLPGRPAPLVRPLVIAPDRDYSAPGRTRVLHFRRPAGLCAAFERAEYLVPGETALPLARALVEDPSELARFEPYRQASGGVRDLLVCTHGSVDAACARFGFPLYLALHCRYAQASGGALRVWRVSHFGGHRFAPTLIDLPTGRHWGHLRPDLLDALVLRRGQPADLRACYRGWGALRSVYEAVAEREVWMQEGWRWLGYRIGAETLHADDERGRGVVRLDFRDPLTGRSGCYHATVEQTGTLWTQGNSGSSERAEVRQYRVARLDLTEGLPERSSSA